jgi:hypothetical protein
MTVSEVAALEQVSTRMIQRYCTVGFQGNVLPAVRSGRGFVIEESAYRQWRIACDAQPEPEPQPHLVGSEDSSEPMAPPVPAPLFNPWPIAADPNGELTNGPSEHSRNWPHPLAVEAHREQELFKQIRRLVGAPDEN